MAVLSELNFFLSIAMEKYLTDEKIFGYKSKYFYLFLNDESQRNNKMAYLPNMSKETLATLAEMLQTGELCDLKLKGNDSSKVHNIHALVLASLSDEFHKHCDTSNVENEVPFSGRLLEEVIQLAYYGNCKVEADFIEEAIDISVNYKVIDMEKSCEECLQENVKTENMIDFWQMSKKLSKKTCGKQMLQFVARNIKVADPRLIQDLSIEDIKVLLKENYLNMTTEEASNLLGIWLSENEPPTDSMRQELLELAEIPTKRRIPKTVVLAIGGWGERIPTGVMEFFNPLTEQWKTSQKLRFPFEFPSSIGNVGIAYHNVQRIGDNLFIVGGYTGGHFLNTLMKFDMKNCFYTGSPNNWEVMNPMLSKRCYVSTAVVDEKLYALGGLDSHDTPGRLRTAEVYDSDTGVWTEIESMRNERSDFACVFYQGCIYAIGGFNGDQQLSSIEKYKIETDSWIPVGELSTARSGISAVVMEGRVFILGGYNGQERLKSVECFSINDTQGLEWHDVPDMLEKRSNFGAVLYQNDKIMVIGGFKESTSDGWSVRNVCKDVEIFDMNQNSWSPGPKLDIARSALATLNIENDVLGIK